MGLCLLGNGEHAQVVAEAARLAGQAVEGAFAPAPSAVGQLGHLGTDEGLLAGLAGHPDRSFICATGSIRQQLTDRFADLPWESVIHPSALISSAAVIEPGAFIAAGVIVNTGARIGAHAVLNTGSIVEHDVEVGRGAFLGPGVVVGGGVSIGAWAQIGLGACLRDHIRIGAHVVIGMGAVVIADAETPGPWLGVPARARGLA
jgi:acetyltransferase EpsM